MSRNRRQEIRGIVLMAFGLLTAASLLSYSQSDPSLLSARFPQTPVRNWVGTFGAYLSDMSFQLMGGGAYLLPILFIARGIKDVVVREEKTGWGKRIGLVLLLPSVSAFLDLIAATLPPVSHEVVSGGGIVGKVISDLLRGFFAPLGAFLILLTLLLLSLRLTVSFSLLPFLRTMRRVVKRLIVQTGLLIISAVERAKKRRTTKKMIHRAPSISPMRQPPLPAEQAGPPVVRAGTIVESPPIVEPKRAERQPASGHPRTGSGEPRTPSQEVLPFMKGGEAGYRLPPLSLLTDSPSSGEMAPREDLMAQSQMLEKKFADFGIEGKVTQVLAGPVVTMYEFEPAPGVKVSRIVNLEDDLAVAMKTGSVRVVAPIPGKSVIGIEIPSPQRQEVSLKEILASPEFNKEGRHLPLALGKDIFGRPVVADLTVMPHLLVAGATGSGKSMALNAMICSLLFHASPEKVQLLLIDPKALELTAYENLLHLRQPVITEFQKAKKALSGMISEMQQRYRKMAEMGVRNIEGFNKVSKESDHLPYLIVVIDELADLMMAAAGEVEGYIAHLAQKARAAGIHFIVATQRPSVDVLTGTIKANFPARISFQVSSKTDSRIILDANGAERLLGRGDMLFLTPGTGRMMRLQGPYLSDAETKKVADFVRAQGTPQYEETESGKSFELLFEVTRDEEYQKAVDLVSSTGQASASFIQRKLRVGYPKARRMIDMMEEDGILGPAIGAKPREVLMKRPPHQEEGRDDI